MLSLIGVFRVWLGNVAIWVSYHQERKELWSEITFLVCFIPNITHNILCVVVHVVPVARDSTTGHRYLCNAFCVFTYSFDLSIVVNQQFHFSTLLFRILLAQLNPSYLLCSANWAITWHGALCKKVEVNNSDLEKMNDWNCWFVDWTLLNPCISS